MGKVCISSRYDRHNIFFELWIKNCLNYNFDIVIFLDGKNDAIVERISKPDAQSHKIHIIEVQKYGNIYNIDNLKFFKEIFNTMYTDLGYDTVIYTDPDELLLVNDFNKFLTLNENVLAAKGFEMVQHNNEEPYCLSKPLINQRSFGFWSEESYNSSHAFYNKVCVFKKFNYPTNVGRHASEAFIRPTQIKNEFIFLIHLREICKKTTITNAKENTFKYKKNHKQHSFYSEAEVTTWLNTWFYPYTTKIPQAIKELMIKHNL